MSNESELLIIKLLAEILNVLVQDKNRDCLGWHKDVEEPANAVFEKAQMYLDSTHEKKEAK